MEQTYEYRCVAVCKAIGAEFIEQFGTKGGEGFSYRVQVNVGTPTSQSTGNVWHHYDMEHSVMERIAALMECERAERLEVDHARATVDDYGGLCSECATLRKATDTAREKLGKIGATNASDGRAG